MNEESSRIRAQIVAELEARIAGRIEILRHQFRSNDASVPTRFVAIEDALPERLAREIHAGFPAIDSMRRLSSLREKKYAFKQLGQATAIVEAATFAFQDERIVRLVEAIAGMKHLLPDERLYAGGISAMRPGDYLHPHIDNSHDAERRYYRRLNLLYYVTPGWRVEDGGNLHLWDDKVRRSVPVHSAFNALVIMETNRQSWHSVDTVVGAGPRCCVSNYYFSEASPTGEEYFHVTEFSAPPDEPFRRLWAGIDTRLRTAARLVRRSGFARRDYYK